MFAQVLVHVRVAFLLHGRFNQKIDQIIVEVRPSLPLGRLPAVLPSLESNVPY